MTQEDFFKLTDEELMGLSEEDRLKHYIRFTEERYISYKKMLEDIFKDKINYPPGDEFVDWYKEHLREEKNKAEGSLKQLHTEIMHVKQGMNPPACYPTYKRKDIETVLDVIGSQITQPYYIEVIIVTGGVLATNANHKLVEEFKKHGFNFKDEPITQTNDDGIAWTFMDKNSGLVQK